jgi:hypothetical protein
MHTLAGGVSQTLGVPAQALLVQVSATVQALPSSHVAPWMKEYEHVLFVHVPCCA